MLGAEMHLHKYGNGNTSSINVPYEITGISNIKEISAGRQTSFIVTKSGEVFACRSKRFRTARKR